MKDQIKIVILKTDASETMPAVQYIAEPRLIKRMSEGESKSLVMEEIYAETLFEDVAKLVEEIQIPDTPPYSSTVVLNDGRRLAAPKEALEARMLQAWDDAKEYQEMLEKNFGGSQMMGAVACPDFSQQLQNAANNSMGGMGSLAGMGMNAALEHPAIQEPVQTVPQGAVRTGEHTWNCSCGQTGLSAKFCPACGSPAPAAQPATWDCPNCTARDLTGKFCPECGTPMPVQE